MTAQKYRPAFTSQELAYIKDLCRADKRESTVSMAHKISRRLEVFGLKAQIGLVAPAFTATEERSIDERLGLDTVSPADKRLAAYQKWKLNPDICSTVELNLANTYRYENDLMTSEEEQEQEKVK